MSDGAGERIADHAVGSGWLQVLAPDGRVLVGGVVVGPKVGDRHLPLQMGAASSVDASGTLLVGARSDGEALVCYLPELLKQAARAHGSDD
jgi:hypothetical protein